MEYGDHSALTAEVARKALSRLGRHPITLQHAMLEMSLSGAGLSNIDALAQFPNIMHLDISKNTLQSLAVLSSLPTLVELNAR
jgi:Leucine-rich repeat (LRR) protein